jgi:cupin 2 domain-containing protein
MAAAGAVDPIGNRAGGDFHRTAARLALERERYGMDKMGSLLEGIPAELPEEFFDTICSTACVKIERIVSKGHASPKDFWYDQDWNEFVLVVQGSAGVKFEGEDDLVVLKAGDYLNISPHVKHRVGWTDSSCETIWLAVHYSNSGGATLVER